MKLVILGPGQTEVVLDNAIVLFSYETPVAIMVDEDLGYVFYRTAKRWSSTTERHINRWLGTYGKVANEKPQEYFDNLIVGVL